MQQQQASRTIHDITAGLRTDRTKEEYSRAFYAFLRYTKPNSKEELLKRDPEEIEELIVEYLIEYLVKQRHLKYSSIPLY